MKTHFSKKIVAILLMAALVVTSTGVWQGQETNAATVVEDRLITVGGKTITESMKIADIKGLFGEPKLVTTSYWGGSAYTFYGENYSDYLYLETYEDGSIAGYGSVSEGFETNTLSYGDVCDNYVRIGTEATDYDDVLYGVMRYTDYHGDAYEIFAEDLVENNRSICRHATEMWNAISYLYGSDTPTTFDETLFNINAQLAENGSDWYEYCNNTDRGAYFQLCSKGSIGFTQYEYPNPLAFAQRARNYTCKEGYVPAFMYIVAGDNTTPMQTTGFINPDILAEWKSVSYTREEQELLQKSRAEYMNSIEVFNSQTSYYDIEPDYSSLPLTGGKLSENAAKGAVGYLNSIRVGAGLSPLEYSEELSEAAQCKSTYLIYLSENDIAVSNGHVPQQIEGIDDEYYAKCQTGAGENLFMCGILSTNIIGSITNALDDSYGSGQYYSRGHRYNLLDPNWKYIGVGNTLQQGCHKMSGYVESDVEVVAWPSKGIMPVESGFSASGMMTCQFYNGYMGTDETTVTIHCLNNDRTWVIDPAKLSDGQDMKISGSLISYTDNSISFARGGVYEITFKGLKNAQGEETSYTYRSVYETAYLEDAESSVPQSLTLGSSSMTLKPGVTKRVKATIEPATAHNKRIHWESEDTSVATVNECGEITAVSLGETTITALTEDGNVSAVCKVVVSDKEESIEIPQFILGDVDANKIIELTDAQLALKFALKITGANEEQKVTADVDYDGEITLADAQKILKAALKIELLAK